MIRLFKAVHFFIAAALLMALHSADTVWAAENAKALENLDVLIKTKICTGCDLSGLSMTRLDLADANLEGADLSGSKLSLTNLARANLRNANLRGTVFGGADLSDADLRGADLRGASVDSSYHQGALFDGKFVVDTPYAGVGEGEIEKIEKKVFVADPAKPKAIPETPAVTVGEQRESRADSAKIPAVMGAATVGESESVEKQVAAETTRGHAPVAKKIVPVQKAVVDDIPDSSEKHDEPLHLRKDNSVADAGVKSSQEPVEEKPSVIRNSDVKQEVADQKPSAPHQEEIDKIKSAEASKPAGEEKERVQAEKKAEKAQPPVAVKTESETKPEGEHPAKKNAEKMKKTASSGEVVANGTGKLSKNFATSTTKDDNLARLLDKNSCYGCDLSGLDLSGKNLDGADLEKANLTGSNLEKADLDKANLKGAFLVKTNLRQASLRNADFYKADLTGADLTGAKMEGAMFDNAETASAEGLQEVVRPAGK